jgi:hypothetical protein
MDQVPFFSRLNHRNCRQYALGNARSLARLARGFVSGQAGAHRNSEQRISQGSIEVFNFCPA